MSDTHPATTPIGYSPSFKPKPRRKATHRYYGKCRSKTPCGGECILNGAVYHTYHTCKSAECGACHGEKRFRYK